MGAVEVRADGVDAATFARLAAAIADALPDWTVDVHVGATPTVHAATRRADPTPEPDRQATPTPPPDPGVWDPDPERTVPPAAERGLKGSYRWRPEQKALILAAADQRGVAETAARFEVSSSLIYLWRSDVRRAARHLQPAPTPPPAPPHPPHPEPELERDPPPPAPPPAQRPRLGILAERSGGEGERRPYECGCGRRFHSFGQWQRHRPIPTSDSPDHRLVRAPDADPYAAALAADG